MNRWTCLAGVVVLWCGGLAMGQMADAGKLVQVHPLGGRGYQPGVPLRVGVKFKIAPKWHIYWLNPGDSGQQTAVKLALPPGWKQGEWEFPIPKKFSQPGDFVGYGYEEEVVLVTTLTPPAEAKGPVEIKGTAVYLVCEAVCVPGQATVSFKLSEEGGGDTRAMAELAGWEKKLPNREVVKLAGQELKEGEGYREMRVELPVEEGSTGVEVFPLPSSTVDVEKVEGNFESNNGKPMVVVRISAKLYSGQSEPKPGIRLLVVSSSTKREGAVGPVTEGSSGRTGRWFDLPLSAARP